jgi:hypothetical protein
MLHLPKDSGAYSPDTIAVMTRAFEKACATLSMRPEGSNGVRQSLALNILHLIDEGERDPDQLARLAANELTRRGHANTG